MPLHQLSVLPADVAGARLGLALNAPAPAPLASHRLTHPDAGTLVLGILGASHVISVEHATSPFSEEISCTANQRGGVLPEHVDAPGYHLTSHTADLTEARFRALAEWLREQCHSESGWLGGTFPGDDAALTAISASADGTGWHWHTWHLYPASSGGTVVHTESRWRP
ncbi:Protein of unknown function DUF2617 [Mycobacterium sp. JS623]|uniref:DUF2617 family protein n=1 Tax=Mycobacterium sp. JS623 TaxID=212767 RepID=UPI0002A5A320|nr:DUF2617 family protein [Mycobacterium sp. JS623]AGB22576.1 Protein of unknown function DUF2617 [Mycobacterium sp. JS623]